LVCAASALALGEEVRYQRGPPGLIAGAHTAPGVGMEVLVERDVVTPLRIFLEEADVPEHGATARSIAHEDSLESLRQVVCDLR
jgi:hypothetical protein